MSSKVKNIYDTVIEGARSGLTDDRLFRHVLEHCPKATSKKIVRASLLALSDPDVKDKTTLDVMYALAIKHRLVPLSKNDLKEMKDKPEPTRAKKANKNSAPDRARGER